MQGVAGPVSIERRGSVSVLRINNPPVNAVSPDVVQGLIAMLDVFEQDTGSEGLVIACSGRTFVAGGDIASFEAHDFSTAQYNGLLARLEASNRPVVAALFGTVLGGGLELALACHWRMATASTVLRLPEVKVEALAVEDKTMVLRRLPAIETLRQVWVQNFLVENPPGGPPRVLWLAHDNAPLWSSATSPRLMTPTRATTRRASRSGPATSCT